MNFFAKLRDFVSAGLKLLILAMTATALAATGFGICRGIWNYIVN